MTDYTATIRRRVLSKVGGRLVGVVVLSMLGTLGLTALGESAARAAGTDPCATGNAIVCENSKTGNPASEWDISGAGDDAIQGFSTQMSVTPGATVKFKIKATKAYTIKVYRLGYYQGLGARLQSDTISVATPGTQPSCISDSSTNNFDCGNWSVSSQWAVPSTAVSGIYIAHLVQTDGQDSHITFVVRDDSSHSDVIFKTSDMTWQAYNEYGGSDFYVSPNGLTETQARAFKISYNRPYATRSSSSGRDFVFSNEYPTLRFLERNGIDTSYTSDIDVSEGNTTLTNHKAFLSVGHDEYWSLPERTRVEAARDAGVNMMFLSGNEVYWHTRLEPSIDGNATADRTLVCYKDTWDNTKLDPTAEGTSTWRDPRFSAKPNGRNPENALTGTAYMANSDDFPITVSKAEGKLRIWRNTSLATTSAASTALAPHTIGYESDEDLDNGSRPAGLFHLSTFTGASAQQVQNPAGDRVAPGTTTHNLTMYRAASGALVFGAGTVQWGWGLDQNHDGDNSNAADSRMQQATLNVLADMQVFPTTLMSGLTMPTASTDTTAPTVNVTSPAPRATIANGTTLTVTGTAADDAGVVTTVEVSLDGGATYHRATGTTSWSYTGVLAGDGSSSILVRASDDSANLSSPISVGVTVPCPCTLFGTAVPQTAAFNDSAASEVGVKFSAKTDGYISAIKFYKGTGNGGTHIGTLWSSTGDVLGSGVFSNETDTGWQTLYLTPAVAITAGTTYIASYYAPQGHYAGDINYFAVVDHPQTPLFAGGMASNIVNGVYASGHAFPSNGSASNNNYYVDVSFARTDTNPPVVVKQTPNPGASSVASTVKPTATFATPIDPNSLTFTLTAPDGTAVPGVGSYDAPTKTATFTPTNPLDRSTTFTASVTASSTSGTPMSAPVTWSFTTAAVDPVPGSCPCSFMPDSATPDNLSDADSSSVELGRKFTAEADGQITGVRFYKGPQNLGTHVGSVWTSTGTLLGSVTFSGETTSGWQTAYFASPVSITADTTYIVSYRAPQGAFSFTLGGLAGPVDADPLHSPAQGALYTYAASGVPTFASNANYYVDVVYVATDATPMVTGTSPAANEAHVNPSRGISATFKSGIQSGTAQIKVTAPDGTAVSGTTTYTGVNRTVTFTPSAQLAFGAQYTATVSGARSISGKSLDPVTWLFTTSSPAECLCSIFGTAATPAIADGNDGSSLEAGTSFVAQADGRITGMRFYKADSNTGTHTGTLWSSTGQRLITGTFTGESANGWQTLMFSRAIRITAGTTYVVSYYAPRGHYSVSSHTFDVPYYSPLITVPAGNGLYKYGSSGFPTQSFGATNYWVDVILDTTVVTDTTAPFVIGEDPLAGSTSQSRSGVVTVSWDDDVAPSSVALSLTDSSGNAVPGTVTYDPIAAASTFTASSSLPAGSSYTVSAKATDLAGNAMQTPTTWTYRTALPDPVVGTCPCGLFTDSTTPGTINADDPNQVELGVQFSPDQNGLVSAVRFYKGSANLGTHTVSLWTDGGQLLAKGTSSSAESTQGWQTVSFATPVAVTAGASYIASYNAPRGSYATDSTGLHNPMDVGPLHTPVDGGRYVYGTAFPGNAVAYNYYVDPVFSLTPPAADTTPPVITSVASSVYDLGAVVTWTTDETSTSVVEYGSTPSLGSTATGSSDTGHSVTIDGLVPGATYYYHVVSVDASGNSATSPATTGSPATFTTTNTPPPTISSVAVSPTDHAAKVTWTTNISSTSVVTYGSSPDALTGTATGANGTSHTVNITGLQSSTTYYYRVTSSNRPSNDSSSPDQASAPAGFTTPDTIPPVVSGVTASVMGANATIMWNTDESSTSTVNYGPTTDLGMTANGSTGLTHNVQLFSLPDRTTYYYQVVSTDAAGNTTTSPVSPATFAVGDLTPPTITAVKAVVSGNTATVTWTSDESSTSVVTYGTSATALASSASGASGTSHSVTLSGLADGTTYYYRVNSVDAAGNAGQSPADPDAPASFVSGDTTAPVITAVTATPTSDTTATITWTTNEIGTSQVDYGTTSALGSTVTATAGTTHSVPLSGLTSGVTYYYRVTSADASGNSSTSPVAGSAAATFQTADSTPPTITAVTATPAASGTSATIAWTTDESATSVVSYGKDPSSLTAAPAGTSGTSHSVVLSGLSDGSTYYYRVTSTDPSGNASTSPVATAAPATFVTPDVTAPVVTAVTATPNGGTGATITWTTDEASSSVVSYGTSATSLTSTATTPGNVTAHSVALTGLTSGVTYYYRVTSADAAGNTTTSPATGTAAASFQTADVTPPTITAVTATPAASGNAATIAWTTDESSTTVVSYGTTPDLTNTPVTGVSGTAHSITLSGLSSQTTYYYRVTSTDPSGNSSTSPVATAAPATFVTPDVTAPTISAVQAAPNGATAETISWTTDEISSTSVVYGTSATTLDKTATGTAGTSHTVALSGLASGTTFYYRVTSADAADNTTTSPATGTAAASFQTADVTPPTITAVTATPAASGNAATIAWTTDESSTTVVSYGTTPDLTNTPVTGVSGTAHSITLSGLSSQTTYYYRVTSTDPSGNSSTSPVATATPATFVTPDVTAPTISTVTATPGASGSTATVTWTTDEASSSVVSYGTSATALTQTATSAGSVTSHSVSLTGLTSATTYYYRVSSADTAGNTGTSPASPASPATFATPDVTAPKVTGPSATTSAQPQGVGTTTITWTTDEVSSTVVSYGTAANSLTSTATGPSGVTSHSVALTGLGSGVTYYYRVTSADPSANTTTAPVATAAAATFVAPDVVAPTISAVATSTTTATVTWTTNETATSVVSYGTTPTTLTSTATGASGTAHSVTLPVVLDGSTYYYRVTSVDPSGNSSTSPVSTSAAATYVVPDKTAPTVSAITATGSGTTATVTWTTNESSTSVVKYGTSATNLNLTANGNTGTAHSVSLTGLTMNVRYYYRVTSVDAAGNSATSPATTSAAASYVPTVAPIVQTTAADFSAGTLTNAYVSQTGDGEVMQAPSTGVEFGGTALPNNLTSATITPGGTTTVSGGKASLSGTRVTSTGSATSPKSIEFAVSALNSSMRVGFGTSDGTVFAGFGVNGSGQLIGVAASPATTTVVLSGIDPTQPHRYRVDWTSATRVTFVVDGNAVSSNVVFNRSAALMAVMQNTATTAPALAVDWLRVSPFGPSGTFTSKVIDASSTVGWDTLSYGSTVPAGTTLTVQVRTGTSATPPTGSAAGNGWTAWTTVASSGASIASSSRYIQYQIVMTGPTSGNRFVSSSADSVQIGFHVL